MFVSIQHQSWFQLTYTFLWGLRCHICSISEATKHIFRFCFVSLYKKSWRRKNKINPKIWLLENLLIIISLGNCMRLLNMILTKDTSMYVHLFKDRYFPLLFIQSSYILTSLVRDNLKNQNDRYCNWFVLVIFVIVFK